ncbi:MAG: T9SS type A sorting domain-containing protein [Ignavibacteria bacterium]|nr:T9SS type A sorting domain-containing protein [Ignavibacteria bacterium]
MLKKIFPLFLLFTGLVFSQALNVTIQPKFIEGINGTNAARMPFAYFATLSGLTPNATYRYFNQFVISTDLPTANGAGNVIFVRSDSDFVRTSGPSLATYGNYGTFTTDASGNYTGWFVNEPTGNATRFIPGNYVFLRININDGANGTTVATRLTSTDSTQVIKFDTAPTNAGSGLWSRSTAPAKSFVVLYDNEAGTGRPLAATFVENDGTANTTANSYAPFYSDSVNAITGSWGVIIPNTNPLGVRRIEARMMNGTPYPNAATDADGVWGSVNTVNPTVGVAAMMIPSELAPLPVELTSFSVSTSGSRVILSWTTATEVNNRAFEVERKDNSAWRTIGSVAGNGTTTAPKSYSFTDESAFSGRVEYRLKQIDFDGTSSYSNSVEVDMTPMEFGLSQNYPNPFNPSTVISFSLPVSSNVSLKVYNTLGEKVAELVNGVMPAGNHSVEFNAAKLNSGLYIYEIKAGEFTSSRKMLLLK